MSDMFNTIPLTVKLRILGIYPLDFMLKRTKTLDFSLLQARRVIALCWKSMNAPWLEMRKRRYRTVSDWRD